MIEARYSDLGQKRRAEGLSLSEVLDALILTKLHLRDYIRSAGLANSAIDLYQELELDRLTGHFFDKAIYYAAKGYGREAARQKPTRPRAGINRGGRASG